MQDLRQAPELLSFIRPADWLLFTSPKGINFRSLQNSLGSSVKTTVDKLNILRDVRTNELMQIFNEQYSNVSLESSNKLEVNSVVLLKNIANEAKREPLRLARVNEIKKSRDGSQRVVAVTYHNININKKGEWIGTPTRVERCVKDFVLVDVALNDSILSPEVSGKSTSGGLEVPSAEALPGMDLTNTHWIFQTYLRQSPQILVMGK